MEHSPANGRLSERLCRSLPVWCEGLTWDGKSLANLLFCVGWLKVTARRSISDGVICPPVPKENLANPGNSWRCLSSTVLIISCDKLQTPGTFANSSDQSVCSAVTAYYLYKCSLMHESFISCSFKEQIHSFPGQFRCQFFCSTKCGACLPVPNPSWLSTPWNGFCFMLDPCRAGSHVCPAVQRWFCGGSWVQEEPWIRWWSR